MLPFSLCLPQVCDFQVPALQVTKLFALNSLLYEETIVAGAIAGCFFSIYQRYGQIGSFMLSHVGVMETTWYAATSIPTTL